MAPSFTTREERRAYFRKRIRNVFIRQTVQSLLNWLSIPVTDREEAALIAKEILTADDMLLRWLQSLPYHGPEMRPLSRPGRSSVNNTISDLRAARKRLFEGRKSPHHDYYKPLMEHEDMVQLRRDVGSELIRRLKEDRAWCKDPPNSLYGNDKEYVNKARARCAAREPVLMMVAEDLIDFMSR